MNATIGKNSGTSFKNGARTRYRGFAASALTLALLLGAGAAHAQRDDSFSQERMRALSQKEPIDLNDPRRPSRDPLLVDNRLWMVDLRYERGVIGVDFEVAWPRANGRNIEGVVAEVVVLYRGDDKPSDQVVPVLSGKTGKTDAAGFGRVDIVHPGPNGLAPGEYFVKLQLNVGAQTEAVRKALSEDPALYGDMDDEKAKLGFRPVRPGEREKVFNWLVTGDTVIPAVLGKIYIGDKDDFWVDNGTLSAFEEIKQRTHYVGLCSNNIVQAKAEKKPQDEIEALEERLRQAQERLQLGGGEITPEEVAAINKALKNKRRLTVNILKFSNEQKMKFVRLIKGDFPYWHWKAVHLYGNTVHAICAVKEGERAILPWQDPVVVKRAAEEFKIKVADEKTWKAYLKKDRDRRVKGDPSTWAKPGTPAAAPAQEELRGGMYSDRVLRLMLKDIDEFRLMDYLTPQDNGYVLNEEAWGEFEQRFLEEIGFDEYLGEKALSFRAFDSQKTDASTGDRVRELDLSRHYGEGMNRFPVSVRRLNDAFWALAHMPMAFRYSHLAALQKLDIQELSRRLGNEKLFPTRARRGITILDSDHKTNLEAIRKLLQYDSGAQFRLWFYEEGAGRNRDAAAKTKAIEEAKKKIEKEYASTPNAPDTSTTPGSSDIIIEEEDTGEVHPGGE